MGFRFAHPVFFLLLAVLPAVYLVFRRFASRTTPAVDNLRLATRLSSLLMLIVALAAPQISREIDRVNLLYLVDISDSMGPDIEDKAIEYINLTAKQRGENDTFGVMVFGADASGEVLLSAMPGEISFESLVDTSGTDIESALYRAVSLFPDTGENRIVLLSDGNETTGGARNAAHVLKSMNIQVFSKDLEREAIGNEVLIQDIVLPAVVNAGQVHDVTMLVQSENETEALLYIFRDGVYMGEDSVSLHPGSNRFTYTSRIDESGAHLYEVYIEPYDDTVQENNQYRASIRVRGEPTVLYVSQEGQSSPQFLSALRTQGITTESVLPESIPTDLRSLLPYDAVVLDNVPAFDISIASMELLRTYVKDLGGGLLMVGGDQSFGIGGYFGTPIEKALPVDMDVTSSVNIPSLALFMVVDKSGSMGDTIASGETKLDLVKEAVIASIEVLNPFYTVALLAFDADYEWTVPPTSAGSRQEIIADMVGLKASGGTHLFPALQEAYERMKETPAAVKHILVLSDGLTDEGDFEGLALEMIADHITLSTVSVGEDSDRELLSMIATVGGGRSYFTDDIQRIPRIFASESIIISRGLIVEEPFIPMQGFLSKIVGGLDFATVPPVLGFVLTYPKTGAQAVLTAFNNSPLLSTWRYGLGRSAAYTSDFKGKWGIDLIAWDDFPVFVAQLMRWLRRAPDAGNFSVSVDETGLLTVDAIDERGSFINGLSLEAVILAPDSRSERRALTQSAPGFYELHFKTGESGDYYLTVYGAGENSSIPPETHILTIPYPAEYREFRQNTVLLDQIARVTGGSRLSFAAVGEERLYARSGNTATTYTDLWRFFLPIGLLLFVIDIALRQVLRGRNREERKRNTLRSQSTNRLTYDELLHHLRSEQRRESGRRDMSYWFGPIKKKSDTNLRLYLAKKRRG